MNPPREKTIAQGANAAAVNDGYNVSEPLDGACAGRVLPERRHGVCERRRRLAVRR